MIAISKINNPDYLISHTKHEYYTEGDNQEGYFAGKLCSWQKLSGKEVDKTTFERFMSYGKKEGFYGVEIDPAPPKDFTVLMERADDTEREKFLKMHKLAVQDLIKAIEENTYYRKTEKGNTRYELAKAVSMAHFTHFTSRGVEKNGVLTHDCQLHEHIVVFSRVVGKDGKYHSHTLLDAKYEKNHETLNYFDQIYQHRLAKELQKEGYVIEPGNRDSFTIKGVSKEVTEEFSTRRKKIIETVGEDASYATKSKTSLNTRNKKEYNDLGQLRPEWHKRMDSLGFTEDKLESIKGKQSNQDKSFNEVFTDKAVISKKLLKTKALAESKYSTKTFDEKLTEFHAELKLGKLGKEHYLNTNNKHSKNMDKSINGGNLKPIKGGTEKSTTLKQSDKLQASLNEIRSSYANRIAQILAKQSTKQGLETAELSKAMSDFAKAESEINTQLSQALIEESRQNDYDR